MTHWLDLTVPLLELHEHMEVVNLLKSEHGLGHGHGHAHAIVAYVRAKLDD